jgi:hypothetical protein
MLLSTDNDAFFRLIRYDISFYFLIFFKHSFNYENNIFNYKLFIYLLLNKKKIIKSQDLYSFLNA